MKCTTSILVATVGAVGMIIGSYFAVAQQPPLALESTDTTPPQAKKDSDSHDAAKEFVQDQLLEQRSRDLLSKYRTASKSEDRDHLLSDVSKTVAEQFDVRQRMREKELQRLEDQLKRLRQVHQQRAEQKDRIVNDHVQQLVREADGLGWGEAPSASWPGIDADQEAALRSAGRADQEAALRESQQEFEQSIRELVEQKLSEEQQNHFVPGAQPAGSP